MAKIRGVKPDYWTDDDIVGLSIPARLLFIGMWNYACDNGHLQDKPKQIKLRILPGDDVNVAELLRELAKASRIQRVAGHITIPNFAKHQKPDKRFWQVCDIPDCVKPDSQPESRGVHPEPTPSAPRGPVEPTSGTHGDGEGEGELKVMGKEQAATSRLATTRGDIEALCNHLADRIAQDGSKRPTITKAWLDAARLMLDKDDRTEAEVHAAIDWCQAHHFWRTNVLSMPKLREKFDQLRKVAQSEAQPAKRRNDIDWDLAQERARIMDGAR